MKVELRDIHKTFGPVYANNGLNLTFLSGKIQGILGENGAGKSTLMKILSGFYQADRGEIYLDGKQVVILSPADAIVHGIGMLHQDPLDFPPMQVLSDFLMGAKGHIFPDRDKAKKEFLNRCQEFDFDIDPDNYVDALTVGERQQLEILRLLWLGAEVLILDEPTTGISAPQKKKLFVTLRKLAAEGMTIVFVSHKLEDVGELCDRVAVLRAGELVGEMDPPFENDKLIGLMFGKLVLKDQRLKIQTGQPVIEMQDVSLEDYRLQMKGINIKVSQGEVIGLAGMEGSGQTLFLRACAGLLRPVGGELFVQNEAITGKPYHSFLQKGVTYLPAARLEEGLIPGLTLSEHFSLLDSNRSLFIDQKRALKVCNERIKEYNIRGRDSSRVEMLSGGNQQRALLALLKDTLSLILLEHPTRGLDVESSIYIWGKLKARCSEGAAIIFISSDLEEVLNYSDRILVFFSGQISKPLDATTTTVEDLGELIGGNNWDTKSSFLDLMIQTKGHSRWINIRIPGCRNHCGARVYDNRPAFNRDTANKSVPAVALWDCGLHEQRLECPCVLDATLDYDCRAAGDLCGRIMEYWRRRPDHYGGHFLNLAPAGLTKQLLARRDYHRVSNPGRNRGGNSLGFAGRHPQDFWRR